VVGIKSLQRETNNREYARRDEWVNQKLQGVGNSKKFIDDRGSRVAHKTRAKYIEEIVGEVEKRGWQWSGWK